ncbi:MAG: hypothetical protein JNK82_02115 [Myxococcaceae bacterium]|nr:hypothetical protein [Myxococcaceae bacterium]
MSLPVALAFALAAAPTGNPLLDEAVRQYDALDEVAALSTLARAKAWPQNTPHQLALVHLYTGLAHAGLAHEAEALASFESALVLEPELELPPGLSPRVRAWWARAGGALREPPSALRPADAPRVDAPPPLEAPQRVEPAAVPDLMGREAEAPVAVRRPLGIALAAAGAGALVAAVVLSVQAVELGNRANAEGRGIGEAQALYADARLRSQISTGLYVGAAAALAGGGLLALIP